MSKTVEVTQADDRAQLLQDFMEQHHGRCLRASEWDAIVAFLDSQPRTASEQPRTDARGEAAEALTRTLASIIWKMDEDGEVPASMLEPIELPDGRKGRSGLYITARKCALAALSHPAEAKHGWVFYGPDGEWHWSAERDTHESVTDQRPATAVEAALAQEQSRTDAPGEPQRECETCGAVVAAWPNVMCCHCQEVPWKLSHPTQEQPLASREEGKPIGEYLPTGAERSPQAAAQRVLAFLDWAGEGPGSAGPAMHYADLRILANAAAQEQPRSTDSVVSHEVGAGDTQTGLHPADDKQTDSEGLADPRDLAFDIFKRGWTCGQFAKGRPNPGDEIDFWYSDEQADLRSRLAALRRTSPPPSEGG